MKRFKLIFTCSWYWANAVISDTEWTKYTTSKTFLNKRLLTGLEDFFDPLYYSKDTSLLSARIQCSSACSSNSSCVAFNIYETDTSLVCELQPDHFCGSKTTKSMISSPNSTIWFKQTPDTNTTCFKSMLTSFPCSLVRYGCSGNYPNCTNCPKTCVDCDARGLTTSMNLCVLWPDGDTNFTALPIFVICNKTRTVLIQKTVDLVTGFMLIYRLSFVNINRLYRLKVYSLLTFAFDDGLTTKSAIYDNWYIAANGTLSNITHTDRVVQNTDLAGDIFQLNGKRLQPVPFVTVILDIYYCGSFWLLNPNNATYCPGGKLSLFGTPRYLLSGNGNHVSVTITSTGIRYPGISANKLITFVNVELTGH